MKASNVPWVMASCRCCEMAMSTGVKRLEGFRRALREQIDAAVERIESHLVVEANLAELGIEISWVDEPFIDYTTLEASAYTFRVRSRGAWQAVAR